MKKRSCSSHGSEKSETKAKKDKKFISFDYTNNLQCFIASTEKNTSRHFSKISHKDQQSRPNPKEQTKPEQPQKLNPENPELTLRVPRKYKGKLTSNSHNTFSNKVLLLQYVAEEETIRESKLQRRERRKDSPKSEEENQAVTQLVNSCIKVITQDTQYSSNPITARYTSSEGSISKANSMQMMPMMMNNMYSEDYYYYAAKVPAPRNRRAISYEQSRAFFIDISKVQADGRTTIMVRNIPNKYTQDMLLSLFEKNHKKKFDFFYLPVDYSNNCNVGYAFVNFIHSKFIVDFYKEFHEQKWNKFNSNKVCQVCYARIQGTAQLQNHFQNSNVLKQKDHHLRPLIGIKSFQENISHLLQKQKGQHSGDSDES